MAEPTITPEDAEELFEGEGVVGEWAWKTAELLDSGRWDQHHRMILHHVLTDTFYALHYSTGLTENQPNSFPWVKDMWTGQYEEMDLRRVYPHRVLSTVYKTTPPLGELYSNKAWMELEKAKLALQQAQACAASSKCIMVNSSTPITITNP